MVFVYTAKGVLCVEHANVLELCYIELLSGDSSPYSILSVLKKLRIKWNFELTVFELTVPDLYKVSKLWKIVWLDYLRTTLLSFFGFLF